MRIAILSLHSCPLCKPGSRYNGGMSIYIRELVQELTSGGHQIDIYTGSHGNEEHGCNLLPEQNVRLIHVELRNPYRSDLNDMASIISQACDQIYAHGDGYDIIHSHYWISGLAGLKLAKNWKIPHVTTFHTLGAIKNRLGLGYKETDLRLESETAIAKNCDAIIATTERERHEIMGMSGCDHGKIYRVPCGVNTRTFRSIDRSSAKKMCGLDSKITGLFVGRADPVKGLRLLMQAMDGVNIPDFQILIIGGDDTSDRSISRCESVGNSIVGIKKMNFVGSVEHGEMYKYYNAADFCVIPSYYESFSLVALESLACGTPLLATNVGGIQEIARHNRDCHIIPTISAENLYAGLQNIISSIRGNMPDTVQLRALVQDYGWDLIAKRVMAVYCRQRQKPPLKKHAACI